MSPAPPTWWKMRSSLKTRCLIVVQRFSRDSVFSTRSPPAWSKIRSPVKTTFYCNTATFKRLRIFHHAVNKHFLNLLFRSENEYSPTKFSAFFLIEVANIKLNSFKLKWQKLHIVVIWQAYWKWNNSTSLKQIVQWHRDNVLAWRWHNVHLYIMARNFLPLSTSCIQHCSKLTILSRNLIVMKTVQYILIDIDVNLLCSTLKQFKALEPAFDHMINAPSILYKRFYSWGRLRSNTCEITTVCNILTGRTRSWQ